MVSYVGIIVAFEIVSTTELEPIEAIQDLFSSAKRDLDAYSAAVVFIAPGVDAKAVHCELQSTLGNLDVQFVGCTALHMQSKARQLKSHRDETVVAFLISRTGDFLAGNFPAIASPSERHIVFSVNDVNVDEMLKQYVFFGGIAAGDLGMSERYVFANNIFTASGTVGLRLPTNCLTLINDACGWSESNDAWAGRVTKSNGLQVNEISGLSATEFYLRAVRHKELSIMHPIKLVDRDIYRAVMEVDEETGSLNTASSIPEGTLIKIGEARRASLIGDLDETVKASRFALKEPGPVFAISCGSRFQSLANFFTKEYEMLSTDSTALVVYLYGQFKPAQGYTRLENQRIVIGKFYE